MLAPTNNQSIDAVWRPIPGSSQEIALDTRCHHTLYTGSRGPGKSDTQLMRFRRRVGVGYGAFWRGIIFDREYKNLDDLVQKSLRWFNQFDDGAKFLSSARDYKWKWPTGEELLFRAIKKKYEYWNYHGHEYPFIGWNELAKYPTPDLYDMMMSVNRTSFTPEKDSPRDKSGKIIKLMPPIPLEVFSTTNPYGAGHGWVKRRFIDAAPYGKVVRTEIEIFNPKTRKKEPMVKTQVAVFGTYRENIYLPPEYIAELEKQKDPNLRKAWLLGDWNIVAGGAVSDLWDSSVHVVPRFKIPATWYIDRCFDWGSTHPFYVGWFAVSNGEEVKLDNGGTMCFAPGSIILFHEWYGCREVGSNTGLALSAGAIADGIIEREASLVSGEWCAMRPWPGPADNQIRNVRETDVDTIEKKMQDRKVYWEESDKSPGSRKIGLQLFRDMLENSIKKEGPGFYVMNHCSAAIGTVPTLPRDEKNLDDVDTDAEDHPYDVIRYRVLKGANRIATKLNVIFPR